MWRRGRQADGPRLIIFGLGNPGAKYADTRHNVGWWILDSLAAKHGAGGGFSRHQSLARQIELLTGKVLLVYPQTYMNLSGQAVATWTKEHAGAPWLVVHDDVALPPGELRLRRTGGAGGHNGVQSLIDILRTTQFDRLKVGVGPPATSAELADYVLRPPAAGELGLIQQSVTKAVEVLEVLAAHGFDKASQVATGGEAKHRERRERKAAEASPPAEDPST